ncbi:MAG: DsrE family protein [Phycisphaeraceae bacterium]|nr:MAG: DsrE family protein [Phycisphaeraceae bacterium]
MEQDEAGTKLAVLWTSGDPEVAHRVGLMYTHAAQRQQWFDTTRLIIWGPSQKLVIADKDVQAKVLQMMEDGVTVQACVVCATMYGLVDDLRALGIEVKPMGLPLTDLIQSGWDVLTF